MNYYRHNKKKAGQSTIEYMILVVAVTVLVITVLNKQGVFAISVNNTLKLPSVMTNVLANSTTFHQTNI